MFLVNVLQIPSSFTIDLLKGGPRQAIRGGRRLLNTEKLMFRADESHGAEVRHLYLIID
jgi:hypothetical protein